MHSIDVPGRPAIPMTAYGVATTASTVVTALLALTFLPQLAAPCALGALGLGVLHAVTHQSQGSLFDTLVPMGAFTTMLALVGAGLLEAAPSVLPVALLALATQFVWFGTFAGLHDE